MKSLYRRFAINGIKKNLEIYIPFGIAIGFLTMIYNIMVNISENQSFLGHSGMKYVQILLGLGLGVMVLFSILFLLYANNYIMKRRRTEFGLYNILGLEKKQIAKIVIIELFIIAIISIVSGIALSLFLNKLVGDLFFRIIDFKGESPFVPNLSYSLKTFVYFMIISAIIGISRLYNIYKSSSLDLLKDSRKIERNLIPTPIMAILGAGCIGAGYYIALTLESPFYALQSFLLAVILVIVGTYLGFSAISSTILNTLKLNKNFYYKTNNFVAISGLRQRIKQNSSGLASICIMSCAALVLLSSAVGLYYTSNKTIDDMIPRDFTLRINYSLSSEKHEVLKDVIEIVEKKGGSLENDFSIKYGMSVGEKDGKNYKIVEELENFTDYGNAAMLIFVDVNTLENYDGGLNPGESWYYSKDGTDVGEVFLEDFSLKTVKKINDYEFKDALNEFSIFNAVYLFVDNLESVKASLPKTIEEYEFFAFDISGAESQDIFDQIKSLPYEGMRLLEKNSHKTEFMAIYGSVFFVGMFLGTVFIIATALVIYYKQLSEGYEDRYRFKVYRNVGMTEEEVKKSIFTQVKTIFFLPPITAGVHIAVAFGTISYLLSILGLVNAKYKIISTVGVYIFYLLIYGIIYKITSNSYYKIISK